jgi:hypothetical protein
MKEDSTLKKCRTHRDDYKFVAFLIGNIGYRYRKQPIIVTITKVSANVEPLYTPARASGGRCSAV